MMILEGMLTTRNSDGSTNIAPMGPEVDLAQTSFTLKPFQTSTTFKNLKRSGRAVFHVVDDVELLARFAVGEKGCTPDMFPTPSRTGNILADSCRWFELAVEEIDDRSERSRIRCRVCDRGRLRDFWGFNRAKHAVLEAAILATRLDFLDPDEVKRQFLELEVIVEKTAGEQERRAMDILVDTVRRRYEAS